MNIIAQKTPENTTKKPSGKAHLFDLYPRDEEAIKRIRERLELNSSALAVRLAIRSLAKRLLDKRLAENQPPLTPLSTALLLGGVEAQEGGHAQQ